MFSDYYLTIWGIMLRDKGHSQFFIVENYELNPFWQKDIQDHKLFNIRQLITVSAAAGFFIFVFEFYDLGSSYKEVLVGLLLAHYGMLTGRHVSNLLTYSYTKNHPEDLSGKVKQSHIFMLHNSSYQYFVAILPLVIIAVAHPSPLLIGCAAGALFNIVLHKLWINKYRKMN